MSGPLWFRAKRYGWGWTPVTWQGWAVMAAYMAVVLGWAGYEVGGTGRRQPISAVWPGLVVILLLTALLIAICWIRGERPRWRWGK